jgi:hypothetical protein
MSKKSVVIISKKWRGETTLILNATGHIAQAIAQQAVQSQEGEFVDYRTQDDVLLRGVSVHPFVLLSGTPAKMWSFKSDCEQSGLITCAFVESMFHGGTDVQLKTTAERASDEHDLVAIGAFGDEGSLNALTKKFSLFRV